MLLLSLLMLSTVLQGLLIETKSVLPEAVIYAIGNSFNNTVDVLHVVVETDFEESTIGFLDTVQIILEQPWTFQIQIDINNEIGKSVSDHNLWFIDSYKAFRRILRWIPAYQRDSQLYYFIVLRTSEEIENHLLVIQKIFTDFLILMLGNLNIIMDTISGEVLIYTFLPYQEGACRSAEPIVIFRSHNTSIETETVQFFPSKADNLNGCPLRIKTRNELVLILGNYDIRSRIGNAEMSLLELTIIKELSFLMNFTFEIYNSTISGPDNSLSNGEIDVIFGSYSKGPKENQAYSTSVTYFLSWLVIALQRRPDLLRTLVWLFVPFNTTTWACTMGFLVLTTGCIFMSRKIKKLVKIFDLRNSGGLDILSVTIGGSVEHLPKKTFLRLTFIILSLGALIIRSAYLGKLFDAYRGFTVTNTPRSVLELLAENYTIYAHTVYKPIIDELIGLENIHFRDLQRYQGMFNVLAAGKRAFVVSFIYIYTFYTPEQQKDMILKTVLRQQVCMFFPQHSIIAPRVNEIIMRMEDAGILHHVRKNYDSLNKNSLKVAENVHKPIPLVLERFTFTFYLFGMLMGISSVVFVGELLWKRFIETKDKAGNRFVGAGRIRIKRFF